MAKSVESPQFLTLKYLCSVKVLNSPAIGIKWWHKFIFVYELTAENMWQQNQILGYRTR